MVKLPSLRTRQSLPARSIKPQSGSKEVAQYLGQPIVRFERWATASRAKHFKEATATALDGRVARLTLNDGSVWIFRGAIEGNTHPERALYLTSKHLRLGVVPKTHRVTIEGRDGTLQAYLPAASEPTKRGVAWTNFEGDKTLRGSWQSILRTSVLHCVSTFQDGHSGNLVRVGQSGAPQLKTFDAQYAFESVLLNMSESEPYQGLIEGLRRGRPFALPADLAKDLRGVQVDHWQRELVEQGVKPERAAKALRMLRQIQDHGIYGLLAETPPIYLQKHKDFFQALLQKPEAAWLRSQPPFQALIKQG